ncbi:MAP/microtubule affinity-regulating kinase 3 [Geranomyces variabilis]|nr:MAP/microtubule affinity-regulating kinase 3 [Geranomyces variabilis]
MVFVATLSPASPSFDTADLALTLKSTLLPPPNNSASSTSSTSLASSSSSSSLSSSSSTASTRQSRAKLHPPLVDQPWWHGNPAKSPASPGRAEPGDSATQCTKLENVPRRPRNPPAHAIAAGRRYNSSVELRGDDLAVGAERLKLQPLPQQQQRTSGELRTSAGPPSSTSISPRPPSVQTDINNYTNNYNRINYHHKASPNSLSSKSRAVSEPLLDKFFQVTGWRKPAPSDWQHSTKGHTARPLSAKEETAATAAAAEPVVGAMTATPAVNETVGPYIILKTLGSGAFSHVKLAVHARDGVRVAIKMLEKITPKSHHAAAAGGAAAHAYLATQARNEASIISSLNHPNIVRLLTTFETDRFSCLVLEYVPNSDLYDLITNHPASLTPQFVRRIFRELVSAVAYLHAQNIAHCDLKIENILVDSDTGVKVTDFGLAQRFVPDGPLLTTRCGSEEYAAPELIQALPYDGRKIDVWALGIVLFTLLTNEMPFTHRPGERPRRMFHRIARGDYAFPLAGGRQPAGEMAKDLVKRMLTTNPAKRITAEEILRHPYLTGEESVLQPEPASPASSEG